MTLKVETSRINVYYNTKVNPCLFIWGASILPLKSHQHVQHID